MPKWLENCQICNDGLRIRFEELKKEGFSEREAAETMADEACQQYPELKDEFSADRIRMRYRYHTKREMEEILPPKPVTEDEWPKCKKCGWPVKIGGSLPIGERDEDGWQSYGPAPAKHGLCHRCRQKEIREKKLEKLQCDFDARAQDFEQAPIDPLAEADWAKFAEQLEELLTLDFAIGKISPEMFDRVWSAFRILDDAIGQVCELSQAPVFST